MSGGYILKSIGLSKYFGGIHALDELDVNVKTCILKYRGVKYTPVIYYVCMYMLFSGVFIFIS